MANPVQLPIKNQTELVAWQSQPLQCLILHHVTQYFQTDKNSCADSLSRLLDLHMSHGENPMLRRGVPCLFEYPGCATFWKSALDKLVESGAIQTRSCPTQ